MKFAIVDIPVDCILGNVFLAAVEPHGSTRLKGSRAGYFISVPTSKGGRKRIELPYVSTPRIYTMVQAMQKLDKAESLLSDLKDLKGTLRIEEQLKLPHIKRKIQELKTKIEEKCCSKEPNAFWHKKQHTIKLLYKEGYTGKPCKSKAIPMSKEYRELCQTEIQQLLNRGLIRESASPWNCYGFYVNKRAEQIRGIPRLVINYKPLNSVLADDTYPIPHKGDLIRRIAGAKIFSKFDLKAGFWQVAIDEQDKFKTAFSIPAGHYEWNVMPFGLKNAPSKFQKVMDNIFKPYFNWLIVYIDDVLIFSKNIDDHFKHVNIFMKLVQKNGLVLSKKKIEVFQTSIKFLGHKICNGQISLQQHAIEFADKFPDVIRDKTQLQRFLGCLNYVSSFYQDCASDRKVLNERTKDNPPPWTDIHTRAIQEIKAKVKSLPILYVADDQAPKIVESDASDIGWGGVLKQKVGKEEQVVQFASGVWNPTEQKYSVIEREVKAAWNCISKFAVYFINKPFLLRSDASAMKKVLSKDIKKPEEAKFARWQALFANFDFSVEHIKGENNCLPDFLSGEYIEQKEAHVMMIITEWDQHQKQEILRTIPDDLDWDTYKNNWRPTWQLRNTKVLDANLQPHTDLQHYVPERKVYPKGRKWIHDMIYDKAKADADMARRALEENFHDIGTIWHHGGRSTGIYERYYCIYRTRDLWNRQEHLPVQPCARWPRNDPMVMFPDTVYNFSDYRKLWCDFLNVDDREETHYTKLKFSTLAASQRNQQCEWFQNWWTDYGVNRTAMDPIYHENYERNYCYRCFEHNIGECFHSIYRTVKEMTVKEWDPFHNTNYSLQEHMREHLSWYVLTKVQHQIILGKPMIVRHIYTKACDDIMYKRGRFPDLTVF